MEKILRTIEKFIPKKLYRFGQPVYHYLLALVGAVIYRFPSRQIVVIGLTGTNGKSTTTYLLSRFLEGSGESVASISSIQYRLAGKESLNLTGRTMPGRFFIQKFLREAVKAGCKYFVLETTSEGVLQSRHRFIDFDVVGMTNLTKEHIERHKGFENYRSAKGKIFETLKKSIKKNNIKKTAIINLVDTHADYFLGFWAEQKIGYAIKNSKVEKKLEEKVSQFIKPEEYQITEHGIDFKFEGIEFKTTLKGEYNLENIFLAISILKTLGLYDAKVVAQVLSEELIIAGRMEPVLAGQSFKVFIDYAHTPDALQKVYESLREILPEGGKLISVFGSAGGGRDKWKRKEMGAISAIFCDRIILTEDDSYEEEPIEIIKEIKTGIPEDKPTLEIPERFEAIKTALELAGPNDIVLIAGRGSEKIMTKGSVNIDFDDKEVAVRILKEIKK